MNNKEVHTIHLTKEQINQYINGDLSDKEMHVIERHLLSCEFCSEAMGGYENSITEINIDLELDDLSNRIKSRVAPSKKKRKFVLFRIAAIALALIVSGIFITNYFINDIKEAQFSEKKEVKEVKEVKEAEEEKEEIKSKVESKVEQEKSTMKIGDSIVVPVSTSLSANSNSGYANTQNVQYTSTSNDVTVDEVDITAYEVPLADEDDVNLDAITIQSSVKSERSSVQARSMKSAQSEMADEIIDEESKIKGLVIDEESNEGLPFVSVVNLDKDLGTQTDIDGEFELEAEEGDEIVVSYIGYNTQSIELTDEQEVIISMNAGVALDEFVVTKKTKEKSIDLSPKPLIGYKGYKSYLKENLQFPQAAIDAGIKGKVIVKFIIDEKGALSDFTITKSLGYGCDEEAIRLIKEGPAWQAAVKDDKTISQEVKVKVNFK